MASSFSSAFVKALAQGEDEQIRAAALRLAGDLTTSYTWMFQFAAENLSDAACASRQRKLAEEIIIPAFINVLENPGPADNTMKYSWVGGLARIAEAPHFRDLAQNKIIPALRAFREKQSANESVTSLVDTYLGDINLTHGLTEDPAKPAATPA